MCRWVWTVVFLYLSAFPQAVRRMCRHGQKNRATRGATRGATTHHSAAKAKVEKPTSVISGVLKPGYTTKNWFLAVCVHRRLPVSLSVVFFPPPSSCPSSTGFSLTLFLFFAPAPESLSHYSLCASLEQFQWQKMKTGRIHYSTPNSSQPPCVYVALISVSSFVKIISIQILTQLHIVSLMHMIIYTYFGERLVLGGARGRKTAPPSQGSRYFYSWVIWLPNVIFFFLFQRQRLSFFVIHD